MGANGQGEDEEVLKMVRAMEAQAGSAPDYPPIGLPMHYTIGSIPVQSQDGTAANAILATIIDATGTRKWLMPVEGAINFFEQGLRTAKAAKAGIILPGQ